MKRTRTGVLGKALNKQPLRALNKQLHLARTDRKQKLRFWSWRTATSGWRRGRFPVRT